MSERESPAGPDERSDSPPDTRQRGWRSRIRDGLSPKVSEQHLQEARERHASLSNTVAFFQRTHACETGHSGAPGDTEHCKTCAALALCRELLDQEIHPCLVPRQEQLGHAWRMLSRVKVLLINEVFTEKRLRQQIDFCREEANRLQLTHDDTVIEKLQALTEASSADSLDVERIRRSLSALVERFNSIRTQRIYQQYINIRTYLIALAALCVLSVILIGKADLLIDQPEPKGPVAATSIADGRQGPVPAEARIDGTRGTPREPAPSLASGKGNRGCPRDQRPGTYGYGCILQALEEAGHSPFNPIAFLNELVERNILALVFLGGLVGGFFSVANRARTRNRLPGEDAYTFWYIITKPLIGAMGAMILFILFQNEFISLKVAVTLQVSQTGKIFAFAFLSGFSERLVFPDFR